MDTEVPYVFIPVSLLFQMMYIMCLKVPRKQSKLSEAVPAWLVQLFIHILIVSLGANFGLCVCVIHGHWSAEMNAY